MTVRCNFTSPESGKRLSACVDIWQPLMDQPFCFIHEVIDEEGFEVALSDLTWIERKDLVEAAKKARDEEFVYAK